MSILFGFLGLPSPTAVIILLILAVLLYGQNLPEVARSFGKKFADFRRGMKGIEDQIRSITSDITSPSPSRPTISDSKTRENPNDRDEPTAPKFEPPPG